MKKIGKRWLVWYVTKSFQFPGFRKSINDYWFFEVVLFHKCFNWSLANAFKEGVEESQVHKDFKKIAEELPWAYKDWSYEVEKIKYIKENQDYK